jgi:hypothetical protein
MQDRKRRLAVYAHAEKAMPERAAGDCGDAQPVRMNLAMQLIQTIDGQAGELCAVDFRSATGAGGHLIRNSRAVALHLPRLLVEQQRAD